jgi:hypothetical protein
MVTMLMFESKQAAVVEHCIGLIVINDSAWALISKQFESIHVNKRPSNQASKCPTYGACIPGHRALFVHSGPHLVIYLDVDR